MSSPPTTSTRPRDSGPSRRRRRRGRPAEVASPAARIGPSARRAAQATEREAWAIVATVDGLGPAAFAALLARYGDARSVLAAGASPRAATRFAALRDEERDRPWMTTNVG